MSYEVRIKDTATGETRIYRQPSAWNETEEFMWSDGNYACDCNRAHCFDYAGGDLPRDRACGDDRFVVTGITEGGVEVYASEEGP